METLIDIMFAGLLTSIVISLPSLWILANYSGDGRWGPYFKAARDDKKLYLPIIAMVLTFGSIVGIITLVAIGR